MVLPIIIIGIIAVIGGVMVFSPAGDLIRDVLEQSSLIDPKEQQFQIIDDEEQVQVSEDLVEGFESFINEMIGVGRGMGNDAIEASEFEGNPIGMTESEAQHISDTGTDFFEAFAQFFFKGHAFIVAIIDGFSPVELGIAIVSIIALLVTLFLMLIHVKSMGKHMLIIVMVISGLVLIMLIVGGQASI